MFCSIRDWISIVKQISIRGRAIFPSLFRSVVSLTKHYDSLFIIIAICELHLTLFCRTAAVKEDDHDKLVTI